jgi:hypothetical protein
MTDGKDWSAVTLGGGAELIVGWRPARARLDAAAIELSQEVAAEIHAAGQAALDHLAGLSGRPYGGAPYIEPDEEYLAVPTADLLHHEVLHPDVRDRDALGPESPGPDETGLSDLERLVATAGRPPLSREDLRGGRYLFYAAICTDAGSGERIGFVRQTDPHRVAKAGGFMALLGQEGLQHLQDPVFVFEAGFDLVVAPDEVAVLRLEAFNRMFADLNTLAAAAPANAKLVADAVRQLSPAALEGLISAAAARPSLARRLQRLARPGAVPALTPGDLTAAMTKHGLDPAEVVSNDEIVFAADSAAVFLDLIEQLYYEADFTGEHRRSDRYSPLGHAK